MHSKIGWLGMITFLVAYGLVSNGVVGSTGVPYNLMNVVGATAIAYSVLPAKAWPVIALELCFVAIGIHAIVKALW